MDLYAIGLKALEQFLSPDIEIHSCQNCYAEQDCGVYLANFRGSPVWKKIFIPTPETETCLFVLLHEVGHFVFKHDPHVRNLQQELQASEWAKSFMAANGVEVPAELWQKALAWAGTNRDNPIIVP